MNDYCTAGHQLRYRQLRGTSARLQAARYWKALHQRSPKLARALWRASEEMRKRLEAEFAEALFNTDNSQGLF